MPLVKGPLSTPTGYIIINQKLWFKKAIKFDDDWDEAFFVDFDNGRNVEDGRSAGAAYADFYQAITSSSACGSIYIRPRTTVGSRGTHQTPITPNSDQAANWTIPRTKHHMTVVGVAVGGGLQNGVILRGYTALTTPTILVLSPYCTFENIGFDPLSAQVSGSLKTLGTTVGTNEGFACTVDGCNFHVAQGAGAIVFDSGRYNKCLNSQFWHCVNGVNIGASAISNHGTIVRNNDFHGRDTDVDTDIQIATGDHTTIDNNRFHHEIPAKTTGAYKRYIKVVTSGRGMVSDNFFATTETDIDVACDLNSMVAVANKCAADTIWIK